MDFDERMKALRPEADASFEGACLGSGYKPLDDWALEMAKVLWSGMMIKEEHEHERSEVIEEHHPDGYEGGDEERLLERDVQSP